MTLVPAVLAVLAASPAPSPKPSPAPAARELRFGGLLQAWATLAVHERLRTGSLEVAPNRYYGLRSEFTEDGLSLRRVEVRASGRVHPRVEFTVMADLALQTNVLQDVVITLRPASRLAVRAGQFKAIQTYEGVASSGDLLFPERGQAARAFGDIRDRGVTAAWTFDGGGATWAPTVGVFNGAGKVNDASRAKDLVARLEVRRGPRHLGGVYGLLGRSDAPSRGRVALAFAGDGAPTPGEVLDQDDRTSNVGAFYVLQAGPWRGEAEFIRGRLGRRFPSIGAAPGPARREHLEQSFRAVALTGAWTRRRLTVALRYDVLDFNAGDRFHGERDPYREAGSDGPSFTETSLGGRWALEAGDPAAASFRLAYVHRRGRFLRLDGSPPRGGDSLVAALQVAF